MSQHHSAKFGPGWKVQIIGQKPIYHYRDQMGLYAITEDVRADMEALTAPVVVIEKPKPANVLEDLADALPDTGYERIGPEHSVEEPW